MPNTFKDIAPSCPWRRTYWKDSMYGHSCAVLENADIQARENKECIEKNCAIQHFITESNEEAQ